MFSIDQIIGYFSSGHLLIKVSYTIFIQKLAETMYSFEAQLRRNLVPFILEDSVEFFQTGFSFSQSIRTYLLNDCQAWTPIFHGLSLNSTRVDHWESS